MNYPIFSFEYRFHTIKNINFWYKKSGIHIQEQLEPTKTSMVKFDTIIVKKVLGSQENRIKLHTDSRILTVTHWQRFWRNWNWEYIYIFGGAILLKPSLRIFPRWSFRGDLVFLSVSFARKKSSWKEARLSAHAGRKGSGESDSRHWRHRRASFPDTLSSHIYGPVS